MILKCASIDEFNSVNNRIEIHQGIPFGNTIKYAEPIFLASGEVAMQIIDDVLDVLTSEERSRLVIAINKSEMEIE